MVVRRGEALGLDRAAIALLGVPALDPAVGHAKRPGYADVVVLALRDVQDVVLAVAPGCHEIEHLLKKAGSGFSVPVSSAVKVARKGDPSASRNDRAPNAGHWSWRSACSDFASSANAAALSGKPCQALAESRSRTPYFSSAGRPSLRRDDHVDTDEIVGEQARIGHVAGLPVQGQRLLAIDRNAGFGGDPGQAVVMPPSKSISVPTTSKVMYLNSLKPLAKTGSPLRAAELHVLNSTKFRAVRGVGLFQRPGGPGL